MFKPCTTKTSIVNRSFDEMGNLMWQQEAAEFIEQYPQRRRPKTAAALLRQSASAGTLYRKTETVMPVLNKRASGGELLTAQQRHQRDLFSGDIGIPDVSSHVGSMVHNFENMALQRQLTGRQRDHHVREHSKYLAELMAMQATEEAETVATPPATATATAPAPAGTILAATTTTKRTFIPSSGTHNNNSKFQQLKKKTHETRQKIIQQILQNHPMHKDVTKIQGTPRHMKGIKQASSNSEVYYRNIDEDYRKNLFATITQRQVSNEKLPSSSDIETSSFCDQIVAQAFDEIFEGYSGLEDEEEIQELKQLDTSMPDFSNATHFLNNYARPALISKNLPPLAVHKKGTAPQPPTTYCSPSTHKKHNLVERFKTSAKKNAAAYKPHKTCSDSLIETKASFPNNRSQCHHKFPADSNLSREVEGQESSDKLDHDFLRGSTVSQSFVRHIKVHRPSKGKAPPIPSLETQSEKKLFKTSEALRQVLLFSKKSKSSGELVADNYTTVETRKYYRRLDDDIMFNAEPIASERKNADGCSSFNKNHVLEI